MLKLHIVSWKLLEPDKCVVAEGVGDLWPYKYEKETSQENVDPSNSG